MPVTKGSKYKYRPDRFVSYELTDEELLAGHILTDTNLKVIQNYVSSYAHETLNIVEDGSNDTKVMIARAYNRGAMEALEHLIVSHEEQINPEQGEEEDN